MPFDAHTHAEPRLLTTSEFARAARVSTRTVRAWVADGHVTPIRLGGPRGQLRFTPDQLLGRR